MIPKSLACPFGALLGLLAVLPAGAADTADTSAVSAAERPATVQSCPASAAVHVAQPALQTDCCKGHKGVCGCRAGKIVCCDGSASPNCTCHGDDGLLD